MGPLSHIPRSRLLLHIGLYAVLFAALAWALPWYLFVPIAVILALANVWNESRQVSRKYQSILDGISSLHGEALDISRIKPSEVDETIYKAFKEVATELERKNFQLVEKNIQLAQHQGDRAHPGLVARRIESSRCGGQLPLQGSRLPRAVRGDLPRPSAAK